MTLQTERLTLIPLTRSDLIAARRDSSSLSSAYNVDIPKLGFFDQLTNRGIYKAKLKIINNNPPAWLLSTSWLIVERKSQTVVGEAGFKGPPSAGSIEIGYGTYKNFRNFNYATESVGELCKFAFSFPICKVKRITALTLPKNIASHKVLKKSQFTYKQKLGRYLLWEKYGADIVNI